MQYFFEVKTLIVIFNLIEVAVAGKMILFEKVKVVFKLLFCHVF